MSAASHLFLALSRGGWGEAAFGLHLAEQLRSRKQNVTFINHVSNSPLFASTGFTHHEVGDHIGSLVWPLITECAREIEASSIVMCDFLTTDGVLRRFGIDGKRLLSCGTPLIAVDTWGHLGRTDEVDLFINKSLVARDWIEEIPCLQPCPMVNPNGRVGQCSFVGPSVALPKSVRAHVREGLGLKSSDAAVLFCTAKWQQTEYADINGDRCAASFSTLLGAYALDLAPNVHLIHVGPAPLQGLNVLEERYHWLPPLGAKFDLVLGAVDLFLSTNLSASTVVRATSSQIPVIMLQNSCRANTIEEALAWLGTRATKTVDVWLKDAVPIFPFVLWPLGFKAFLDPLLKNNPYTETMRIVEWLDKQDFLKALHTLLSSEDEIAALRQKQINYYKTLADLPSSADAFQMLMETQPCNA